jgi:hypothetical protein
MRKRLLLVCSVGLSFALAVAKDKIASQWKCDAKPTLEHSLDAGDQPGHAYSISQGKCTSEKGAMGDVKEQEGTWTQFNDVAGASVPNHGVFIVTLASGDKVHYNYRGASTMKDGKMESGTNTWSITGGTGKFQNVKGQGGCKGKGNPDGSSTWNCDGSYSVGK